jgi:dihydroorotase/N-acyl-D-amino-acid deacylase
MRRVVAEAMDDGAFGLATALIYPPGSFAGTDELTSLCEVVASYGGVHITHLRSEADRFEEGLEEAITIAERSGVTTEIYHLKAAGQRNWPKMPRVIARIDEARAAGLDIGADMYPYPAGGTGLASCLPPWAAADGKLFENVRDPGTRARIREEVLHPTSDWENLGALAGAENVLVCELNHPELTRFQGMTLSAIAAARGQDWIDAAIDLIATEGTWIFTIYTMMSEENLRLQLQQPWMKFGTDAGGHDPAADAARGLVHPRSYGTYSRILGRYVRDEGVLPLEDAVRKASSAVADRLSLRDRGLLRSGMLADVVLFDPATVADRATFTEPHQLSVGIRDVWVNGQRVLRDGTHTGAMPGRRVYGPGRRSDG